MAREYADFFDWPDKRCKERGIAGEFVAALEREGGPKIISAKGSEPGNDPPDCMMVTETGERWGVEITELVSQKAIEKVQRGENVYAPWPDAVLGDRLCKMVARKDDPTKVKGGPYRTICSARSYRRGSSPGAAPAERAGQSDLCNATNRRRLCAGVL